MGYRAVLLQIAVLLAGGIVLTGQPAGATTVDKATLLLRWTQPTAASTAAWNAARRDRKAWAAYDFDWSTDKCSHAPENPFGFNFGPACSHHDFGYRNYRAAGTLDEHRVRLDEMFRADLRRECDSHRLAAQPPCNVLAFTYYETVRILKPNADLG
ncbi:putative prokaryotic phospholipase A2 [Actinoplanes missouriensis 431]|uniref:Putative prokaryotic phospholipase A2 n=1 Tax=Actinoplanes missouriensis (strain ATCC 14538 / DSM 43046 / CBS 188.64 / JCM 3121 / NBRC 102363 / NCIMB 12654 / NRRL B-3342 / UNCC 431) TaxID=512565 RepID=I0HIF7_ACTM4|nr:phospholipase [Actinoplanes missouriensis]BAL92794.1 putative prokaryotic phospholipase A2 [Actinoplanes missouriensis 431]